MEFINKTNLDNKIFNDIVKNIINHININAKNKLKIHYINSIKDIEENSINIIENIIDNNQIEVLYFSDFFIFNNNKYEYESVFEKNNISLAYKNNNTYILSFDIISMINFIIFNDLHFIKKRYFYYAFTENLIMLLGNIIERFAKENTINVKYKNQPGPYFVPSFDIDRINYFNKRKTVFYSIMKLFSKNKKYSLYFKLKKKYKKDIWNNLDYVLKVLEDNKLKAIFFIIMKNKDKFAKRYSFSKAKEIIKKIGSKHLIGVHLSYESGEHPKEIEKEVKKFNKIIKGNITRFHYLFIPQKKHYEILKNNGIKIDSSIGFRHNCGFYKGFSKPYIIPGINIMELPVICMDSAYCFIKNKNPDFSLNTIISEIVKTKGYFTFIFHQSALNEETYNYKYIFDEFMGIYNKFDFENIDIREIIY